MEAEYLKQLTRKKKSTCACGAFQGTGVLWLKTDTVTECLHCLVMFAHVYTLALYVVLRCFMGTPAPFAVPCGLIRKHHAPGGKPSLSLYTVSPVYA